MTFNSNPGIKPVMVCPKWVSTLDQPIAIENVLIYLTCALDHKPSKSKVCNIGGPDQISYGDLVREYARQRGLTRLMIPVACLSVRLFSLWLGLITPVYATIGRKPVESLKNPTAVNDRSTLGACLCNRCHCRFEKPGRTV
ncbi:MAG: hypothetical protein MK102_13845 [Fuerstiella sp.]|nr:hypothetical protein [Fuerstiella sp.]